MKKAGKKTSKKAAKKSGKKVAKKAGSAKKAPAKAMAPRRDDYGTGVDGVFEAMSPPVRKLGLKLREIVRKARPTATELTRWGHAMYDDDGIVCAIMGRRDYATLQFFDASTFKDPDKRLEGTGAGARHVKVRSEADIDAKLFASWIKESGGMRGARGK